MDHLRAGEHVPGVVGMLTVTGLDRLPGVRRVYNMTVERDHTYHVATVGALVHNPGCGPGGLPSNEPDMYGFKPEGYQPPLPEQPLGPPTVEPPADGGVYDLAPGEPVAPILRRRSTEPLQGAQGGVRRIIPDDALSPEMDGRQWRPNSDTWEE